MARIERFRCDRKECTKENAQGFSTFLERRMDGAGSMENWHIQFDLCPDCTAVLMNAALDALGPDKASALLKNNSVSTREV
jgi:hypothetical protein